MKLAAWFVLDPVVPDSNTIMSNNKKIDAVATSRTIIVHGRLVLVYHVQVPYIEYAHRRVRAQTSTRTGA